MKILKVMVLAGLLAGCSQETQDGLRYAVQTYGKELPKNYLIEGETWRIFDRSDLGKLMITPTLEKGMVEGMRRGGSFYLAKKRWTTAAEFEQPVSAYLAQKGCEITDGRLVVDGQFEFDYTC